MENQLQIIVQQSGLEPTKAQYILDNFQSYFSIAAEWEKKAKTIVVTMAEQRAEMKMAREARLFLREKRLDVERARKSLKEQSLREGKAIDGIANVLKALIEPIEEYLEVQENFIEIEAEKETARLYAEEQSRIEARRIAEEKAKEEERLRMIEENAKLKVEAEAREKAMLAERKKMEEERLLLEEKTRKERLAQEEALKKEKERAEEEKRKLEREVRLEAEAREKLEEEKLKRENEEKAKVKAEKEAKKQKAYKTFLTEHGYNKETQDEFSVKVEGNHITLFKKVGEITLE